MNETENNHDDHYQEIEARGVEPIAAMESILCNGIPCAFHAAIVRNFRCAMAAKYLMRLDTKDAPEKEIDKAQNYLHRAITGKWRGQ